MPLLFLIFLMFITGPLVIIEFFVFLIEKRRFLSGFWLHLTEALTLLVYPAIFLFISDLGLENNCCSDTALFSPAHRLSVYILIITCLAAYFFSQWRRRPSPPLLEFLINAALFVAIVMNITLIVHGTHEGWGYWLLGSGPIIIFFLYRILENNRQIIEFFRQHPDQFRTKGKKLLLLFAEQNLIVKFPLLFIICLPFLLLFSSVLMLFGQKPDSLIQAFTDTYRHGLSSLDCSNVTCPDGHFLCTIAANGHRKLVKPVRMGIRQNTAIKVNRQLLIANAFEDLLSDHIPSVHRWIRRVYNFAGGNCKKLYDVLGNQWIADLVYVAMKPLEWSFLVFLYLFDTKPECRIAKQYLHAHHRSIIDKRSEQ